MSFPLRCADHDASNGAGAAREGSGQKFEFHHALLVEIPPRTARGRRWALARGIGEIDTAALAAMVRAERLNFG